MSVALSIQDEGVRGQLESLINEMQDYGIVRGNGDGSSVYLVDVGANPNDALQRAASLKRSGKAYAVLMTGDRVNQDFLIRCMQAGIDEFLPYPVTEQALTSAVSRCKCVTPEQKDVDEKVPGKIYGVVGARTGVGSTTLAVNLALELHKKGGKTALLDFARTSGDVALFLDVVTDYSWSNAVHSLERLDPIFLDGLMYHHSSGLKILAAPCYPDTVLPLHPSAMESILSTACDSFDHIVVDMGGGMSKRLAKLCEMAEKIFMVTLMSLPSLVDGKLILSLCDGCSPLANEKMDLVVNRPSKKVFISMAEVEKITGKPVSFTIPEDGDVVLAAINQGEPLAKLYRKSQSAKAVRKIAGHLGRSSKAKVARVRKFWFI